MIPKRQTVSKEEFINAIPGSYGQLQPIEHKLNCTRKALRDAIAKHPELQEELNDEKARELDLVTIAMFEDAKFGTEKEKPKARELLMKALAKDRGFGEVKDNTQGNSISVYLHTPAKIPEISDWMKTAEQYKEQEEQTIEAEFKKLNI